MQAPVHRDQLGRAFADEVAACWTCGGAGGAAIECSVLSRAVRWHCEDRVLPHGERTVVL